MGTAGPDADNSLTSANAPPAKPRRHWRLLQASFLIVGIAFLLFVAWQVNRAEREAVVADTFFRLERGASCVREERRPQWFWGRLGERHASTVVSVELAHGQEASLSWLKELPNLRKLTLCGEDVKNVIADLKHLPDVEIKVSIDPKNAKDVVPYLKQLPNLREVTIQWWYPDTYPEQWAKRQREDTEASLRREMPNLKVTSSFTD
jgi:hypothetical protein